ncbi:MAG: response regulator [Terracidiphilus sp.]|jgi:CheY-like chemotaxis protein
MPSTQAKLLIVDDEPAIRESLTRVLTEVGYSVRSAEDGFAALHEIRNEPPDLLLSDLNMPRMTGFELLSVVRLRFPAIRVIAMSGWFSGDEVPSGVAADAFYQKGSSILALIRIMETLPPLDRLTRHSTSTSPDVPLWIHRNTHDYSPEAYVTISCPECFRTFPKAIDAGYLKRKTDCIYCRSTIHYAIVPPPDRMPLVVYQRKTAVTIPFPRNATNLGY